MILTSTARVSTERPGRYAKQLTNHLGEKLTTNWDKEAGRGSVILKGEENVTASCDLVAGDGVLLIHIEAPEELLERFEHIMGKHLVRFGHKEQLHIAFRRGDGSEGSVFAPAKEEET